MGAGCCKPAPDESNASGFNNRVKTWKRPRWRSDEPLTESKLKAMREQFWDTEPHYGGDRVIWDALKAACEADVSTARIILETAGVIVSTEDMTICYDERGSKYELPRYVICDPTNLTKERHDSGSKQRSGSSAAQVELSSSSGAGAHGAPAAPAVQAEGPQSVAAQ